MKAGGLRAYISNSVASKMRTVSVLLYLAVVRPFSSIGFGFGAVILKQTLRCWSVSRLRQ